MNSQLPGWNWARHRRRPVLQRGSRSRPGADRACRVILAGARGNRRAAPM